MEIFKKVAVYYRDFPESLSKHISADGKMSFVKDGSLLCEEIGKRMPRITIIMKSAKKTDHLDDKKRLIELIQLLENLKKTNQIISFFTV
ncbi:MAG: hypothetical protein QXL01_00295 [Thermoplasmatales archaeon]